MSSTRSKPPIPLRRCAPSSTHLHFRHLHRCQQARNVHRGFRRRIPETHLQFQIQRLLTRLGRCRLSPFVTRLRSTSDAVFPSRRRQVGPTCLHLVVDDNGDVEPRLEFGYRIELGFEEVPAEGNVGG
ncbi:hypothetical protein ACFX2I_008840 [Malus domestica]